MKPGGTRLIESLNGFFVCPSRHSTLLLQPVRANVRCVSSKVGAPVGIVVCAHFLAMCIAPCIAQCLVLLFISGVPLTSGCAMRFGELVLHDLVAPVPIPAAATATAPAAFIGRDDDVVALLASAVFTIRQLVILERGQEAVVRRNAGIVQRAVDVQFRV